jgi:hypothetical protein
MKNLSYQDKVIYLVNHYGSDTKLAAKLNTTSMSVSRWASGKKPIAVFAEMIDKLYNRLTRNGKGDHT